MFNHHPAIIRRISLLLLRILSHYKEDISIKLSLDGDFNCVLFSSLLGEDSHFDEHMFQGGWFNHQLVTRSVNGICFFLGDFLRRIRSGSVMHHHQTHHQFQGTNPQGFTLDFFFFSRIRKMMIGSNVLVLHVPERRMKGGILNEFGGTCCQFDGLLTF